jgi:hypothetical protein
MTKRSEKQLYRETYNRWMTKLKEDCLPLLRHLSIELPVVEAQILASGTVERAGGERLEYQDIRVYVRAE